MIDNELIFKDRNGHLVVVMNKVVQSLLSHRQLHYFSRESAGVLIGERRGSHLIICDLSEPGPDDIRNRFSVNRKGTHHQVKVDTSFAESDGTQHYLGEWHTHPEDEPTPSSRDKQSWKDNIDASNPMVLLIVGRKKMWVGKKERDTITPLEQYADCR